MILNLTQHAATTEQIIAGVIEFQPTEQKHLQAHLTFNTLPSAAEVIERANNIAMMARELSPKITKAMIGGAPFLMSALEAALGALGIEAVYAFSVRDSVEQTQPDGSVRKVNVFKHVGFVSAV